MDFQTYSRLSKLLKTHGPQEFGRICQGFLGLALKRLGFNTRVRWTERPDILAERNQERYAMGVQSSKSSSVGIRKRDLEGIVEYEKRGYTSCIAVLIMEPDVRWTIIQVKGLRPAEYNKQALRALEFRDFTNEVNEVSPGIVEVFYDIVLGRGSSVLREHLEG